MAVGVIDFERIEKPIQNWSAEEKLHLISEAASRLIGARNAKERKKAAETIQALKDKPVEG